MINIKLETFRNSEDVSKICQTYHDKYYIDMDAYYGRYVIDACSLLGLMSLVGNTIQIRAITDDENISKTLYKELQDKVGGVID